MEYQVGNLPYEQPTDLTTLYDQLNLSYQSRHLNAYVKIEQFQPAAAEKSYRKFTQRGLRFGDDQFMITLGNFSELLGRGLLLRSYEIPGTILEDPGFRVRRGFYRDIEGFALKYQSRFIALKALRGKPLVNSLPPTFAEAARRPNLIDGLEANLHFLKNLNFGGAYLRHSRDQELTKFSTVFISGNLPWGIQIYSEYARQAGGSNDFFDFSHGAAHAFYASASGVRGPAGMSVEYKDYADFNLKFNDPPPLIREHSYVVLNRSTHVLEALNETGWQAEAFLRIAGSHLLTLNASRAENNFFGRKFIFREIFVEFDYALNDLTSVKGFWDRSEDPFKLEKPRHATGLYLEKAWPRAWGTILDLEYQAFDRQPAPAQRVKNYVVAFTLSRAPSVSAGIAWERTTDPLLTDDPNTDVVESRPRHWVGGAFGYKYNDRHFLNLFYGKRRGGPACTAGICYEVLDFEGLEIRISSNF